MRNKLIQVAAVMFFGSVTFAQVVNETEGVSIANDGVPPSRDAVLDVVSSTKGMLVPRVTYATLQVGGALHKDNVSAVVGQDGLLVFVTDDNNNYGYWYFDVRADEWKKLASGAGANFWSSSPLQSIDIETGETTNHIFNTALLNGHVGVGINQAVAQLHVFGEVWDESLPGITLNGCFIAENEEASFGLYDFYPSVGTGNLMIHRKKTRDHNMAWQQRNVGNGSVISLGSYYTDAGNSHYNALSFNGLNDDAQPAPGFVACEGRLVLKTYLGIGHNVVIDELGVHASGMTITSDSTLKTNFEVIEPPIARLKRITGYKYNWASDSRGVGKQYGVVAQNIAREFPELSIEVTTPELAEDGTLTEITHKSVNYAGLIPVLIEGIKEQQETIEDLEERVAVMESKYADLLLRVKALESGK